VVEESYTDPDLVKTAPHNQVVHQLDPTGLDDPNRWATTWRAYQRKRANA
jgi:glycine cleavage system P protein (glycine dehydrogenase) subunit 2